MGAIFTKILKYGTEPKTVDLPENIREDPRSPTEGVYRTPISLDKRSYLETDIDNLTPSLPLRVKLLRKHIDPRSPTEGIDRTPISLLQSSDVLECESPVSLYSNYQPEMESLAFLTSPPEPSVNVSGFEENLEEVIKIMDKSLVINDEPTCPKLQLVPEKSLTNSNSKVICESIIQEIIDSFKECQEELNAKQSVKKVRSKSNAVRKQDIPKNSNLKLSKVRKPLANITSAGNTPTKLTLRKDDKLVKVELSGENSPMNIKTRLQWDNNSTLLI